MYLDPLHLKMTFLSLEKIFWGKITLKAGSSGPVLKLGFHLQYTYNVQLDTDFVSKCMASDVSM